MRFLIADDDFASRKVLRAMLQDYGECDIAVNGTEALEAFINAHKEQKPYSLVCLDIMMPEMDGQEVLVKLRQYEDEYGIIGEAAAKVMMTTALEDFESIITAFNQQCEAYLVKPLDIKKVTSALVRLGITKQI